MIFFFLLWTKLAFFFKKVSSQSLELVTATYFPIPCEKLLVMDLRYNTVIQYTVTITEYFQLCCSLSPLHLVVDAGHFRAVRTRPPPLALQSPQCCHHLHHLTSLPTFRSGSHYPLDIQTRLIPVDIYWIVQSQLHSLLTCYCLPDSDLCLHLFSSCLLALICLLYTTACES